MKARLIEAARYAAMLFAGYLLIDLGPIGGVIAVACGGVVGLGALQLARERRVLLEQRAARGGEPRALADAALGETVAIEGVLRGELVSTPLTAEPTHAIAVLSCRSGSTGAGDVEQPVANQVVASPVLRVEAEGGEAYLEIDPVLVFGTVTARSNWHGRRSVDVPEPAVSAWLESRGVDLDDREASPASTSSAYVYEEVALEPGRAVRVTGEVIGREEQRHASSYREARSHVQLRLGPPPQGALRIDGWTRAQARASEIAHAQLVRLAVTSLIWSVAVAALSV